MSDSNTGGNDRYEHVDIHLCEECRETLDPGSAVVCLSDGRVFGTEYDVVNRRFFHLDCWESSGYVGTGNDHADE